MARFGFIGGTYTLQSSSAAAEECYNWFAQLVESGGGKSAAMFLPSPGLKLFCNLGDPSVRELYEHNGRFFGVGASFYEILADGSKTNYGAVATDSNPASIIAGQGQILIASGGRLYVFTLATNAFTGPLADPIGVIQVGYGDGFYTALLANSNIFRVSAVTDATTWPGAQINAVSFFSENIVSMEFDHRELWLFGNKKTVIYSDTGSLNIFDPLNGAFMEQGAAATFGRSRIDNTIFWVGKNKDGQGMAWRSNGYTPQRISTHAVEAQWQNYSKISDAVSYAFQQDGHSFWHVFFPSVDRFGTSASWRYDVATGLWHKPAYWNAGQASWEAHLSQCHAFAFNKHLVGDWSSGNIYEMSPAYNDDNGTLIRRLRRAPYIASEEEWIDFFKLQVLFESGLALQTGQGSAPVINMRFSDDGGHTWSHEYSIPAGKVGEYKARAIWRRLGRSRGRIFEISVSDPIPWRMIDAFTNDSQEPTPVQRLADRLRSQA